MPLLLSLLAAATAAAQAAPCCSSGGSSLLALQGDERWSLALSVSRSELRSDLGADGIEWPRDPAQVERSLAYQWSVVALLSDLWQAGISIPLVTRTTGEASATGWGDAQAALTYEFLPEFEYSSWRPRGFVSLELVAPLGRSVHEASMEGLVDATSRGFWAPGLALGFLKHWSVLQAGLTLRARQGLARDFGSGVVAPGSEFSARLDASFALPWFHWQLGTALEPVAQASGSAFGNPTRERLTLNASVSLGGPVGERWAWGVAGFDQGFLGIGWNSTLSRGFTVTVSFRDWR